MTVSIRRAVDTDAPQLAALASETFCETFGHLYPPEDLADYLAEAYPPERFRTQLADEETAVWLATEGDALIGYVQVGLCGLPHAEVRPEHGEIKRLYVRGTHQNGGLGRQLVEIALAWLDARSTGPIWLGVYSDNHGAQRFYARYGFVKVGEYEYPVGRTRDREFILRRERTGPV